MVTYNNFEVIKTVETNIQHACGACKDTFIFATVTEQHDWQGLWKKRTRGVSKRDSNDFDCWTFTWTFTDTGERDSSDQISKLYMAFQLRAIYNSTTEINQ